MEMERALSPFDHVVIANVLPIEVADTALTILDSSSWELREGRSFRYETTASGPIAELLVPSIMNKWSALEARLEFNRTTPSIGCHRYCRQAGIAPHTDRGTDEYRFVLSLNRSWDVTHGGIWLLSSQTDLAGPRRYVPPIHNSAFGFLTADNSVHAMTDVESGTLYAIVLTFAPTRSTVQHQ